MTTPDATQKIVIPQNDSTATEEKTRKASRPLRPVMRPHAFVIMPFGTKKGADGQPINFNAIYEHLIKPALESAGFESFRADESTASGDILTDMFQELLLADLCLVDMSIDNANVFYELGIRHAFRKRGIVHIQAGRAYMPFDVFNVRTVPYHITSDGVPDPRFIEKDRQAIVVIARDTWKSDQDAVHSPVFNLLTGLSEPDRKSLRTPLATGFWREYDEWKQRLKVSQRQQHIGDILLLTEEISNPLIKEDAIGEAGRALQSMGRHELALELYRKGLKINSRNIEFRRQEAIFLNRLGRMEEAIVKLENLLLDVPSDTEVIATLGRIYKDMWTDSWKWIKERKTRIRTAYESYHWLLKAFHTYLKGYQQDLDNTYPGINAFTMGALLLYLADQFEDKKAPDPEIRRVRRLLPQIQKTLHFALKTKEREDQADYWSLASFAELQVMTARQTQEVVRAYRNALTAARRNTFFLESSLGQLNILQQLDFREEFVNAGLKAIQDEMRRIRKEENGEQKKRNFASPKQGNVYLFTGYMIDNAGGPESHFPPEKEQDVRNAIHNVLRKYKAGPNDLAVTAGMSAGSEIIFVECCLERGIPVKAYFPLQESDYIKEFISPCGGQWTERFYKNRNHILCEEFYQPDHVGQPRQDDDIYERNNRWALYSAMTRGLDKVRLIALWDGKGNISNDLDAHLVKHMVDLMQDTGGMVEYINPFKLAQEAKGHTIKTPTRKSGTTADKK